VKLSDDCSKYNFGNYGRSLHVVHYNARTIPAAITIRLSVCRLVIAPHSTSKLAKYECLEKIDD